MKEEFSRRSKEWTPAPRPDWVARINEEGSYMDIKSVVPLDENSLLAEAKANTGLTDFGDDDWYEPFQVLIKAFDEESELNLMGRMMTRSDLLIYLQARLQVEDTYKRHPEIDDEKIVQPLYIIGQGRSGTTLLQDVMASDPDNGTTLQWEMMFPCPPPEKETYHTDPRIEKAQGLIGQLNRVVPELAGIHSMAATEPEEGVMLQCMAFRSPAWFTGFGGRVPSYFEYMLKSDMTLAYQYEKRVMKLLQWKNPRKRWVMKSPVYLNDLEAIMKVYPDVGFIWPHRDPVKALSSMINLIGTLMWSRSDRKFSGDEYQVATDAEAGARLVTEPIKLIESGVLPREKLCNVLFKDLVADPLKAVAGIYEYFGSEFGKNSEEAIKHHIEEQRKSPRISHKYELGSDEQVSLEREVFAEYQNYFGVPTEV